MNLPENLLKNKKILIALIVPFLVVGFYGYIAINPFAFTLAFLIPLFPIFFLMKGTPFEDFMIYLAKKSYWISKFSILNFSLKENLTDSDFEIDSVPKTSFWRMWISVAGFGWLLSIALADWSNIEMLIISTGNDPITPVGRVVLASLLFMPISFFIAAAFSMLDTSNLLVISKRGTKTLVGQRLMSILSVILGIITIARQTIFELTEPIDIYRALFTIIIFHSAAIWYWSYFEKDYVKKIQEYLINNGVKIRNV